MIVENLVVENYRGFVLRTSFEFHPKFTVVVGNNGVGKTSVLWALRVMLSHILVATRKKDSSKVSNFHPSDISTGLPYLRAEASVLLSTEVASQATCVAQKNASMVPGPGGGYRRSRVSKPDISDKYEVSFDRSWHDQPRNASAPLAVYYSPYRSIALEKGVIKKRAVAGTRVAYLEALDDRKHHISESARLWRNEEVLAVDGVPARANRAIERALPIFLGEFRNMRVEGDEDPKLVVEKRGTILDLSQLSDGERGLLALLIDLTRRLALANPDLERPAEEGRAVVLIDELDLHMHPRWQRQIVSHLSATFPKCQFIATTHSPQIIGEVQPESLLLLRQEGDRILPQPCGQAYGLDTNHVLEYIMDTPSRATEALQAIGRVETALDENDLEAARSQMEALRKLLHGNDTKVIELEATINNLEALGDATD
jgi:predicted ATP-binding protein involved in virulence